MRTPASAVHYGSAVLHNFIVASHSGRLWHSRARWIISHPKLVAAFGRRVANEAQLRGRSLTRPELYALLNTP